MKLLGNGSSNQKTEEQEKVPPKIPRWLFRILEFLFSLSPRLERELLIFIEDAILSMINLWTTFKKLLRLGGWVIRVVLVTTLLYLLWVNVPTVEIPWYMIVGPPIFSILILILVLMFRKDESTPEGGDSGNLSIGKKLKLKLSKLSLKNWWTNGKLLPLLACFALIHLSVFKLAPKFWVSQAWSTWSSAGWFWGIQIAIAIAAAVKPEDKTKPAKYKFSTVAVFLLVITFVIHLTGWNLENKIEDIRARFGGNSGDQTTRVLRRAPYTPKGTTMYPRAETWPDKEVAEKTMVGQWDLLAACYRESGLKQFNADGSVVTNKNTNGTTDTGICQINSVHDEELKRLKLDKTKLRDNLVFALILYNKEGLRPWATPPGSKLVFEVEVTRKESNTFRLPKVIMGFEHKKPILIAFNDESHVAKEIANELDLTPFTPITDYKFMSATDEKVVITVTYDYK